MSVASPKLKVSSQVLNTHGAVAHTHKKNTQAAKVSAANASAPHATKSGGRKKRRGGGQPIPSLAVASGPPTSSPNAAGNIKDSHSNNAKLVAAAANDSKVAKPKCAGHAQGGGGSRLGQFIEHLHNMEGGKRRKRRTRRKKRHHRKSRRRHTRRNRGRRRRRRRRVRRKRRKRFTTKRRRQRQSRRRLRKTHRR